MVACMIACVDHLDMKLSCKLGALHDVAADSIDSATVRGMHVD